MTKKETIKFTDGGMLDFSKKDYQNNLYLSNIAYYILKNF